MLIKTLQSRFFWMLPVLFWFVVVTFSWMGNHALFEQSIRDIAFERGQIMYDMIRLAKINPVLMAADPKLFKQQNMKDIGYRLVSRTPKNPENKADNWEESALFQFDSGLHHVFEEFLENGEGYFRYMGPVYMEPMCLGCHDTGASQAGDVRGGISVQVKARPIYEAHEGSHRMIDLIHIIGFLLLSASSTFLMYQLRTQWLVLQQTRDELEEKAQFLRGVANCMQDGLVVLNPKGEVTYANPESEWMLERNADQMLGRNFVDMIYKGRGDNFDASQCVINQTLKDGEIRKETDDLLIDRSGEAFPVAMSVAPLMRDKKLSGAVVTFSDISARKQAEEQRSDLERELNQMHKMEAVGQLAGGIAHEINTPIQYVGDNLRFLQDTYKDLEKLLSDYQALLTQAESVEGLKSQVDLVKETIEEIDLEFLQEEAPTALQQSISGAEQVAHIVKAMKEFAHPGQKQMAQADLNQMITNTATVSKNEWKYAADVEFDLAPELPMVVCMAPEISQVVLNLIVNAAHAIQAAGRDGKGTITISTSRLDGHVEIRVSDTGTGIPREAQGSVFNPFFTTKDVGKGTGQGLAICQDVIVTKHHGEIFFETEEGVGTTFVVRLPLEQKSDMPHQESEDAE
jgi:PAS domain S-box-containing protein